MRRVSLAACLALVPAVAAAQGPEDEYVQLGGFFGPRIFSNSALLGYNYDETGHPDLVNSIGFGARVGKPFGVPFLIPEAELVVVPTKTTTVMNVNTSVVWVEPRVNLRI